ncbi:MAG: DUF4345 domain-containing protein [Pseudomonadota bacterium]
MKRGLQIALGVLSLIPLLFAGLGIAQGAAYFLPDGAPAALDNQYRYFSAIYLVVTFTIWWVLPNIEQHKVPVRIIAGVIFLGGLARLLSHLTVGPGQPEQFAGMILEIAVILFIPWQAAVARRAGAG